LEGTSEQIPIYEDSEKCFNEMKPDVLIDLTVPDVGFQNTKIALQKNIRPVVGTSGFSNEQINQLSLLADENTIGCIIAPNFAIGAVLMMLFSKIAANYFSNVEIIEKHHDNKVDAPSGTAVKTLEMMQQVRQKQRQGHPEEYEIIAGSRGGDVDGMKVHS